MKKLLMLFIAAVSLFGLSSCEEVITIESLYKHTVTEFHSPSFFSDEPKVKAYLNRKGFRLADNIIFSGKSEDENDNKAIAAFNLLLDGISVAEIEALGLNAGTTFTVSLSRLMPNPGDDDEGIMKSYSYAAR